MNRILLHPHPLSSDPDTPKIWNVHLVNWVLVSLDNFTIKSQENISEKENSHQNSIGFTKFIANVREN